MGLCLTHLQRDQRSECRNNCGRVSDRAGISNSLTSGSAPGWVTSTVNTETNGATDCELVLEDGFVLCLSPYQALSLLALWSSWYSFGIRLANTELARTLGTGVCKDWVGMDVGAVDTIANSTE